MGPIPTVNHECLEGVKVPVFVDVRRTNCHNPRALACFDFDNTKALVYNLETAVDYRDMVEARCRLAPEGQ